MIPTPQQVIAEFGFLTGIAIRLPSHGQQAQAIAFCKHFTLQDLADVIGWIQRKIASGDKRMDERSLSWRNVFGEYGSGNEFATFQDRLAMAQKTVRTRPAPKLTGVTRNVGNGHTVTVLDDPPEPDTQAAGAEIAEQLAAFRKQMGGR